MAQPLYRITEEQSVEARKEQMAKTILALQPMIDSLPDEGDRKYFKGISSLLIGKDIKLANIEKDKEYALWKFAKLIAVFNYYQNILSRDFIRRYAVEYLNLLGIGVSRDALFIKYGIGGFSRQYLEQKIVGANLEEKK